MIKRTFCTSIKTQLLDTSLKQARVFGFTENSIVKACEEMKINPISGKIIEPIDVVYHAMD